jgi:hypothetical protein
MQSDAPGGTPRQSADAFGITVRERELRQILARVVRIGEAIEDRDLGFAFELTRDLEIDVLGLLGGRA